MIERPYIFKNYWKKNSSSIYGADRDRTDDILRAKQILYQLSYSPSLNQYIIKKRIQLVRT